ncbi:hypothetical protein WA158_006433 [Blastocystis sp. Blastoise]
MSDSINLTTQFISEEYSVYVAKDDFRFSAGHFMAFKGFREPLHGHNYTVSVSLKGPVYSDGYVLDFGDVKSITRRMCKQFNQHFLVPMKSDVLKINVTEKQVEITTEDDSFFSFPLVDCVLLPIIHTSAEEMAKYLCDLFLKELGEETIKKRHIQEIDISVSEITNQTANYHRVIQQ